MKRIVDVSGMHCRSCEILIEDGLKKVPGIKKVRANTQTGKVIISSVYEIPDKVIVDTVESLGYSLGTKELPFVTDDPETYKYLVLSGGLLIIVVIIGNLFGLSNLLAGYGSTNPSLWVVLTVGLTAGFSSCMALVGGLVLGASARYAEKHPDATPIQKFRPHLFFNLGRILSYVVLGGAIGALGGAFKLSGGTLGFITLFVGLVMLLLGIQLTELFPRFSNIFTLPKGLSKLLGLKQKREKEYSHINSMILGGLTFFLPCGFTQAMQVYAISTGKPLSGALIMGVFAVGTTPGLLGIGGLTSVMKNGNFSKLFFKFVALVLILLAVFNISNGLRLTGFRLTFPKSTGSADNTTQSGKIENGIQVVNMTQDSSGYHPYNFTVKKGVPVRWVITSDNSFSCAKSIYMPQMKVNQVLNTGENIINFTPTDVGTIGFSCSMGMFRGQFTVE